MTVPAVAPPSQPSASVTAAPAPRRGRDPWRAGLWIVLLLAAAFRFYGLAWDEWTLSHPDERHVQMSASRLAWPESVGEFYDESRSPLNPRNRGTSYFAYGTVPTTILTACAELSSVTRAEHRTALGRILAALADLGVVLLVFGLARALYPGERRLATLAAGLYAVSVLPIQQAHFFIVDPFANLFSTGCLFLLALAWRRDEAGRPRAGTGCWAVAGVAWGLAIGCKVSMVSLVGPAGLAALGWLLLRRENAPGRRASSGEWLRAAGRLTLFALVGALTVRAVEPDAFSGWVTLAPRWLANMREVTDISRGITDAPFTRQWVNRTPLLYPWANLSLWGLGPVLGLAAWAGLGWAAWRVLRRGELAHWLPVVWTGTLFVAYGVQWQMTMRYFLPIYGSLAVLAAWAIVRLGQRLPRPARAWPAVLVAGGTLAWAVAYLPIYAQPFTRAEASRWIFNHVPAGSTLATEQWDESLPWPLPGLPGPETFRQIDLPWYDVENDGKRDLVLGRLNEADYVILASDKLYGSIPRMPWRYPLAMDYYRGLFDGSLGFDLVAEFRRGMKFLGRWEIPTDGAEEAFSVYDHPRVMIFRKNPAHYSAAALRDRFAALDLSKAIDTQRPPPDPGNPKRRLAKTKLEQDILLPPERWEAQKTAASSTWSTLFPRGSLANQHPLLAWTGLLAALFAAGLPWAWMIGRGLPDRGTGLARLVALALPSWALWMAASLEWTPFRGGTWAGLLVALGMIGWALAAGPRDRRADLVGFVRGEWPRLLAGEGVFWGGFALSLFIRSRNPDIWHVSWGGEKPMEMTYLYGVMKSDFFPPFNPWYAGGFINYYYFGFVLVGAPIKALGLLPSVGFNLALATLFGLTAGAAFTACRGLGKVASGEWRVASEGEPGRTLPSPSSTSEHSPLATRHWPLSFSRPPLWPAFAGVALVLLMGNLFQGKFLWQRLVDLGRGDHELTIPVVSDALRAFHGWAHVRAGESPLTVYESDLYWCAARAIPVSTPEGVPPATEFPFWSFLYADLHPHVIALPFTFALLALLLGMLGAERPRRRAPEDGVAGEMGTALSLVPTGAARAGSLVPKLRLGMRLVRETLFRSGFSPGTGARASEATGETEFRNAGERRPQTEFGNEGTIVERGVERAEWRKRKGAASPQPKTREFFSSFRISHSTFRIFPLAFLLGMFWPTNTWDWPTYAALTGLALFLTCWARETAAAGQRPSPVARFARATVKSVAMFLPTIALGYLLFLPFHRHQVSAYGSFEVWRGDRTGLGDYLVVHGLFLFLVGSAFAVALRDRAASGPLRAMQCWLRMLRGLLSFRRHGPAATLGRALRKRFREEPAAAWIGWALWMAIYALGLTAIVSAAGRLPALLTLGALLAGVLAAEHGGRGRTVPAFAWTMVVVAFGLSLAVEFLVLVGDVGRMNTVFKFYYQVWTLFALASAAFLPGVCGAVARMASRRGRIAWVSALGVLVAAASIYPLTATPAKIADRFDRAQQPGLDGLAFLDRAASTYPVKGHDEPLRPDGAAIRWVQENVPGSPVILEMNTAETMYSWGSRFSIHTGLPSVVGWDWHQRQQQAGITDMKVKERIADVQTLYNTPDVDLSRALLEKYGVGLIVVSGLERAYGTPEGIAKFGVLGNPVLYDRDGVTIYRVARRATLSPPSALAAH